MPYPVTGTGELLQQVLIRLTVPRGGFPLNPELGSRLYLLSGTSPARLSRLAEEYVREALADMRDIQIEQVEAAYSPVKDRLDLTVRAAHAGEILEVRTTL